jgi:hypothetical protein
VKQKYSKEIIPTTTLSTIKPTSPDLQWNPGCRCGSRRLTTRAMAQSLSLQVKQPVMFERRRQISSSFRVQHDQRIKNSAEINKISGVERSDIQINSESTESLNKDRQAIDVLTKRPYRQKRKFLNNFFSNVQQT